MSTIKDNLSSIAFQHTMATPQSIAAGTNNILTYMKATTSISIEDGIISQDNFQQGVAERSQKYPIIVIINGAGGNGKDTFVEAAGKHCAALNLSAISEVTGVVKSMIEISEAYKCGSEPRDPSASMAAKDDAYRTFLHDVKMAWVNFCDGPAHCLYGEIRRAINDQINGNNAYDIIFLHIREVDEITKIKDYLIQQMGLIVITILVRGLVDPSTYTNAGDRDVEKYTYDMTITNRQGMVDMLEMQAQMFADRLVTANMHCGILSPVITSAPDTGITGTPINPDTTVPIGQQTPAASQTGQTSGFRTNNAATGTTGAQ